MGILSSLEKFVGGLIFSLSLGFIIFSLALAQFTEYKSLQPVMTSLLEKQISQQYSTEQLNLTHNALIEQCKDKETINIPLGQNSTVKEVALKCSDISSSQPSDIPKLLSSAIFDDLYYKKYDCQFIQCLQQPGTEKFTVILSSYANKFFNSITVYLAVGLVVGIIILLASTRSLVGTVKSIGISCIFVGITYFIIPFIKKYVVQQLPAEAISSMEEIVNQLLTYLSSIMLYVLIIGVVLTLIGYAAGYLLKRRKNK